MTTEKMTVHKALSELKTLEARIGKVMSDKPFTFANKHANKTVNGISVSAYSEEIRANYQSVNDLIARRSALKRAVVMSNAKATVVIGGETYTVAEAIEFKNHTIPILNSLLQRLETSYVDAQATAKRNNGDALESRADAYVKSIYENADKKNLGAEAAKTREEFIAAQTMEIVDPIHIEDEMRKLEAKINGFMVDVDSALSVSNALTMIEVSY